MPKKVVNKLNKVISTKVNQDVFNALAHTARSTYLGNDISQPTISETLRFMIEIFMGDMEASDDKFFQLSSDLQKSRKQKQAPNERPHTRSYKGNSISIRHPHTNR